MDKPNCEKCDNTGMKTFNDLNFAPHPVMPGLQALMFFPNGYGVSVVRFKSIYGYGSYTNDETEWELAVIKGDEDNWSITYETPVTHDVIGYLKENDVSEIMIKVQQLTRA